MCFSDTALNNVTKTKAVKKPTLKVYSDPGHGWLAVKRKRLEELGLLGKISGYSYERGATVYLEEDCDMSLYLNAEGCETWEQTKAKFNIVQKQVDRNSPIRSYDRFFHGE